MRIGVDVLSPAELDRLTTREWFRRHTYAEEELEYAATLSPSREREFLAGRFAAKEAVVKVLGTGFGRGIRPAQVCVARADRSAPVVRLSGAAARHAEELGLGAITVSIAHKEACVVAVAVAADHSDATHPPCTERGTAPVPPRTESLGYEQVGDMQGTPTPEAPADITATLRVRMGPQDAHYGGELVSGARLLEMFGDLVTEITIKTDGDEGLLTGYQKVEFLAPVSAGDYIEATARLRSRSRLRRTVEFTAYKTVVARYDLGATRAETPAEPVLVCRAVGTAVVPPAAARRASARTDSARTDSARTDSAHTDSAQHMPVLT
ncbi:holo-ACP synthase [Streptomyces sp. B-S-A6]|uniref:Holo-[acyl-carrier-protein] synthase n=2 Tax=Streptomyces cavernicola TaxID=3043613 RepID=A0ABT6SJ40_9ACTN|nr:holo-ACP synthase [Streptomyces sp. B-S-A6]MDI3408216.1 holo-ACP synthase [Streptomyces sp. B-S-A6]